MKLKRSLGYSFFFLSLPLLSFSLMSCSSTIQTRMEKHPEMIAEQSAKHKELILQGKIAEGMNQDAVYLSWGDPSDKIDMFERNEPSTRWNYIKQKPSFTQSITAALSMEMDYAPTRPYGYGPFDYYDSGLGLGTGVQYTPVRTATVLFKKNKVVSWKAERQSQ